MNHLIDKIDKRIIEQFNKNQPFTLESSLILLAEIGSKSHGTYIPPSEKNSIDDVDYMGIVIPPESYTLGLKNWDHATIKFEELDVIFYSLRKFLSLIAKGNPNVIGLLSLRPEMYVYGAPRVSTGLLALKPKIVAKDFTTAFVGYAEGQFKKMTSDDINALQLYQTYQKLINDGGIDPTHVLTASQERLIELSKRPGFTLAEFEKFIALHKKHFSGYMGEKRKQMVIKYGFDPKNASHLIRLLRMCSEFLDTGVLNVYREKDAHELIAIKKGQWTLDQVKAEANRLFKEIRNKEKISKIQQSVNMDQLSEACIDLHVEFYLQRNSI